MPTWVKFFLNFLMHMMILTLILSFLFFAVIVPKEKSALQHEFRESIRSGIRPLLEEGEPLRDVVDTIPQEVLISAYSVYTSGENFVLDALNARTRSIAILLDVFAVVLFVACYMGIRYSCGFCSAMVELAVENVITFLVIGVVEYAFFTRVAVRYIPTPPSFFVVTLKSKLMDVLGQMS